jgi:hypothetical protein
VQILNNFLSLTISEKWEDIHIDIQLMIVLVLIPNGLKIMTILRDIELVELLGNGHLEMNIQFI